MALSVRFRLRSSDYMVSQVTTSDQLTDGRWVDSVFVERYGAA